MAAVQRFRSVSSLPRALLGALFIGPLLTGCLSGDSNNNSSDTNTGTINALGISGLSYQTASQAGKTDARGQFEYYPGENLSLSLGNLPLADGVPAQEWVTPLEFIPEVRRQLTTPAVDEEGLSTHTKTEQRLLRNVTLINLTRFLMAMNWTENVREGEGIEFRDRVIKQLNAALPQLTSPVDFTVSATEFNATGEQPSPANQLLSAICFYPEGDELCEDPPTQEAIDNAPERPENENDWDPDVDYKQDLEAKKERIIAAARSMEEIDAEDARVYLSRELKRISTIIGNRFYLDDDIAKVAPGDTRIKQVRIRRIAGEVNLSDIEAITTRPQNVMLHSYDWQSAEIEYFSEGPAGGESEIVTSFLPVNTYRWVRKQLRVVITD